MDALSPPHLRRNLFLGILNGVLVNVGLAFVDPFTVLPVFITSLGGSTVMVGLATALYSAGWFLPQMFVARYVEPMRYTLPIYNVMAVFRVAAYAGIVAGVFTIGSGNPGALLAVVISCFALISLSAGVTGVPFLEVATKTIPVGIRGSFFGYRRLFGGLLGIFAGIVVAVVLGAERDTPWSRGALYDIAVDLAAKVGISGHAFPFNYGILFTIGGVLAALGYLAFAFVKEPPAQTTRARRSLAEHTRAGWDLLHGHANYRLFLIVRICWQLTAMAFPFYTTFAFARMGFSTGHVGILVSVWVGSGVVSNYVWGKLMDRRGNRIVLVLTAAMSVVSPLVFLLLANRAATGWAAFAVVTAMFFLNGFARSGRFISNMTYLLEFAPQERRPLYVGFMNTLSSPFALSPVLGGAIIGMVSYEALFAIALVFAVINTILSARLAEPRDRGIPVESSASMPG